MVTHEARPERPPRGAAAQGFYHGGRTRAGRAAGAGAHAAACALRPRASSRARCSGHEQAAASALRLRARKPCALLRPGACSHVRAPADRSFACPPHAVQARFLWPSAFFSVVKILTLPQAGTCGRQSGRLPVQRSAPAFSRPRITVSHVTKRDAHETRLALAGRPAGGLSGRGVASSLRSSQ